MVLTVVAATLIWGARQEYQRALEQEYRFLEAHARIADAQVGAAVHNIDQLLQRMAEDRLATPAWGPAEIEARHQQRVTQEPEINFLLTTDRNGRIITANSSRSAEAAARARGFDASGRDYFRVHRDSAEVQAHGYYVSRPFKNTSGSISFVVSRPIRDARGGFAGVAAATLSPQYFDSVLSQVKPLGDDSIATLINRHGDVLYRLPEAQRYIGSSVADGQQFKDFLRSGQSAYRSQGESVLSPGARVFFFRWIGDTTLGIALSRHSEDVFAEWRRGLFDRSLIFVLAALVTLSLTWIAMRRNDEREAAEAQLRLLAKVFESGSEAFVITDAHNNILAVNPSFTALTGYSEAEVLGKNPRLLSSGQESKDFFANMWQAILASGHWEGEIVDRRKNGQTYPKWMNIDVLKDSQGRITHFVASFSDITERKRADERIRHLAQHDILTGLANRSLFSDRIAQAVAQAKRHPFMFAVLFLDLDRFKNVNDSLGHHVGDLLLQEVAKRLLASVRETDTVCRQGGDEFIVLALDIGTAQHAAAIAAKMLKLLSQPYLLDGTELNLTPSIGIAIYPQDGGSEEEIMKNADAAMYHAKESGRGQYQFFTESLGAGGRDRLRIEADLRKALPRGELVLHFQPKFDLATRTISGCEALVRWQHPQAGLIGPADFIPVAEDAGLIIAIGDWVLETACREAVRLQSAGLTGLVMSVNVSALQLRQPDYVERVMTALERTGLEPARLELEFTESMIMHNVDEVTALLERLHGAGIQLAVDDFGTGYSSLAYLKRFPIHVLKIDQSFVRDIMTDRDDAAIVQAIIAMAKNLRLGVIAEGVETREQLDFLEAHGCDAIQGYLIAKPLPSESFLQLRPALQAGAAPAAAPVA